jgi:hypothetical protein
MSKLAASQVKGRHRILVIAPGYLVGEPYRAESNCSSRRTKRGGVAIGLVSCELIAPTPETGRKPQARAFPPPWGPAGCPAGHKRGRGVLSGLTAREGAAGFAGRT